MTPEEFRKMITNISQFIAANRQNYLLLGAKRIEGLLKRRVFNDGKDSKGDSIGQYKSKPWKKKREKEGRQIGFVDLEFTGDLRNSIQVVSEGNDVYLAIIRDADFVKAKGNEERRKKDIFLPTEDERERTEKYIEDLIAEDFDKLLRAI